MTLLFEDDPRNIKCPVCGKKAVLNREVITEGVDFFNCLDCGAETKCLWKSFIEYSKLPKFHRDKAYKTFQRKQKREELEREAERLDLFESSGFNKLEEEFEEKKKNESCCRPKDVRIAGEMVRPIGSSSYTTISGTSGVTF